MRKNVLNIIDKYVSKVIVGKEILFQKVSPSLCSRIVSELHNIKTSLIEKIIQHIPNISQIDQFELEAHINKNQDKINAIKEELHLLNDEMIEYKRNFESNRMKFEADLDEKIKSFQNNNCVLLSDRILDELKKNKFESFSSKSKSAIKKYGSNLLKPETVLKMLEFFGKMTTD